MRYDTELVPVCKASRICVLRRRENREHGGTQVAKSIWALADDGSVRCQHKLPDTGETVPYFSFFDQEKVSLAASLDEIVLRFHAANWGDFPASETKTTWVSYIFASDVEAGAFQSAVYGRSLLGYFRTIKTTVIHEGFKGAFSFEEQFANIDMLRLWEEDGLATPGAQGGVLALMHMSSNFGEGWASWWMNNSKQHVRVREDGPKSAKIKGIDIAVPGSVAVVSRRSGSITGGGLQRVPSSKPAMRRVDGINVEFKTTKERDAFVALSKRIQEKMLPLPNNV